MTIVTDILNEIDEKYDLAMPAQIKIIRDFINFGYDGGFESKDPKSTKLSDYFVPATPENMKKYNTVDSIDADEDSGSTLIPAGAIFKLKNGYYISDHENNKKLKMSRAERLFIPPVIYDAGDGVYWTEK